MRRIDTIAITVIQVEGIAFSIYYTCTIVVIIAAGNDPHRHQ